MHFDQSCHPRRARTFSLVETNLSQPTGFRSCRCRVVNGADYCCHLLQNEPLLCRCPVKNATKHAQACRRARTHSGRIGFSIVDLAGTGKHTRELCSCMSLLLQPTTTRPVRLFLVRSQNVAYLSIAHKGPGMCSLHAIQDMALPLVYYMYSSRAHPGSITGVTVPNSHT